MNFDCRWLFRLLLSKLNVDFVCDIGSCTGSDSLYFRNILPKAKILAFEANPINYELMKKDEKLRNNRIEAFPFAITNYNGKAEFNIYKGSTKGLSSLYKRLYQSEVKLEQKVHVKTYRIDSFILNNNYSMGKGALWIDVEGAEYEVVEGMENIKDLVCLVNIEIGMKKIFSDQKIKNDVVKLMDSYNFIEIGMRFHDKNKITGDILFLNKRFQISSVYLLYIKFKAFLIELIKPLVPKIKNLLKPVNYNRLKKFYINHFIKK